MRTSTRVLFLVAGTIVLAACTPKPADLKKLLVENPDILVAAIEKHPKEIGEAVQRSMETVRRGVMERQAVVDKAQREKYLKEPLQTKVEGRVANGDPKAPLTIVVFTEFQCNLCRDGNWTLKELRRKYGDKLRVVYKHMPLGMHPAAMAAALRFEAIGAQDPRKAVLFMDELFGQPQALNTGGEKYLDTVVKKVGANAARVAKDIKAPELRARIEGDRHEAGTLHLPGPPSFLVMGVPVLGNQPLPVFEQILDESLNKSAPPAK